MNDHIANLRDLVGVLQTMARNTDVLAKLVRHEVDAVEHQLRDYEAAFDGRADRQQNEVVF